MQSGLIFKMQYRIRAKLETAGATSIDKAVTIEEADFNQQELNWLNYVAGGLVSEVKKTKDRRYYINAYTI
jgi:hypothetical protein